MAGIKGMISEFSEDLCTGWFDTAGGWVDSLFELVAHPFEFDWLSTLMTEFQGIALAVVFIIVIVRGITTGILLNGGSQEESVGHYLFTAFVPIALIAATPAIVGAISQAATALASAAVDSQTVGICTTIMEGCTTSGKMPSDNGGFLLGDPFVSAGVSIAVLYYGITITIQCLKRWCLLEVLSLISPLVCIATATEDNASYVTLLKSMFAIGLTTMIQVTLFYSAALGPVFGAALATSVSADPFTLGAQNLAALYGAFFSIAILSATKNVPAWIERYTETASMPGRGGVARALGGGIRTARALMPRGGGK